MEGKRVKEFESFKKQAQRRLSYLNDAESLEELANRPSNRFHALSGSLEESYSISINKQYRIVFSWDKEKGDASHVRITDYH